MIRGNLDNNKKSHTSCQVDPIKNLIIRPFNDISIPVLSFRLTQEAVLDKINILATFGGNLVKAMKYQKGSPIEYGS